MNRSMKRLALSAGLAILSSAPCLATPTVKYEFVRDSSSVTLSGGSTVTCGGGGYYLGTPTLHFNDSLVGGATVTFQAAYLCENSAGSLLVNGSAAGGFGSAINSCCGSSFVILTATITTQYNNALTGKTIAVTSAGNLVPLTGSTSLSDPMFRVSVTMVPGISTPTPGGFTNSTLPTLSWPAAPGAASYQVQLALDPFFTAPVMDVSGIATNTVGVGSVLVNGNTYYTRVKASGGTYTGIWSYVGDFTVATTIPSVPVLVSPPNPSNVPVQTPTFNWNPVTLGAE